VVNLSFGAEPQSYYWDDPLNQAVMLLWQAGIVVVTSAGNRGPDAMTIGVPGNVPYVITVGAEVKYRLMDAARPAASRQSALSRSGERLRERLGRLRLLRHRRPGQSARRRVPVVG
jgi:subtilisin family serine protease